MQCQPLSHLDHQQSASTAPTLVIMSTDEPNVAVPNHPQISVTDVQGSEVTLVALSDQSHDSEDSLDAHHLSSMQGNQERRRNESKW